MKLWNKRIISLLMALVMLCGMMPMTAFAVEEAEKSPWEGRSAVFVGDSITAGSGTTKLYYRFLEESLGFCSVTAMGIGGSCISAASDYGTGNQPLINRYQNIPSTDLIVIFMGTNDYGHETPLGSVGDTKDGTFYGALNSIVPALVAKHTSSKIVFVTPLHRYGFGTSKILGTRFTYDNIPNGVGATLGDYVNALKTVCATHGVSVIDLYTESEMDPRLDPKNTAYFPDGLHPNAAGHELIAGIMESHIRGYEPVKIEPIVQTELIQGNKFSASNDQPCRASSRVNYYLKAGTVITLKNPDVMQWACAKTNGELSSTNLGYFPDSQWSDKETAVVAEDGWVGFVFKYRDETKAFDLSKPLSEYITIEEPHTHSYQSTVTAPTCTEQGYTTYTCECGDSYVADYVDATGHIYENGSCTGCGVKEWDSDGDGVLEILAIGNSFSVDALQYAYQIAQNLGIEEIVIGNLYIGGCTLATHAANAAGDLGKYTYYYNDNGTWTSTGSYKISTALESRSWDYVSMQQGSPVSGVESSYNEDLTNLIAYVKERSDAKLVWHMTWAYQQNSTHSAFPTYGKDQMTMYNAIVSAVQNKIVTNENFDLIVPNGTAVQNSRTSLLGDTTTRDGYHMSYDYGRYLTGLLFVKTLTDLDISNVTYAPSGVDAEEKQIAIESVNNAYKTHFAVTESAYQKEAVVIPEGYVQQNLGLTALGYWNSSDKNGDHNKIITTADNSKQYYATVQFTREQLPVDSVILLADGWQYRPEGWITDAVHTNRPVTTTESYVVVTEEWWSNYTLRAFNISKVGLSSLSGVTEADICEAFQIYVPTRAHIHDYTTVVTAPTCTEQGYTTYTCACGDNYVADYVDALGHIYENGICTVCGAEHPNLANYEDKVISILGDSISTFAGYIPVADGFNLQHYARYPQDNLFTEVEHTWWMQVLTALDAKLGINESWRSTEVGNIYDVEVNSGYEGTKACMASITRIQNLGSNGTPDVILFYGGTNDITQRRTVGTFNPVTAPTEVDLTSVKWDTVADAYVAAIMRMQHYYPNAEIIAMLPTFTSKNTDAVIEEYNSVFAAICEHYGVTYIDLRDCGITTANLPDGTHPDETGMDYITAAVLDILLTDCNVEAGEHIVHSVTHNLAGAESSLSYYKGISHGKSYVTEITGEDLTVTVTMDGVDITSNCYANGIVSITNVTGDVVITAAGREKTIYDDHLQQLPDNLCCGMNLWNMLTPENQYYTTSGWGNLSAGQVWSITIPVTAGDRIYANSFGKNGSNGNNYSSTSGIRVTYFDAKGLFKSLTPAAVYAEFAANGYLTIPEDVVAVCVPMWTNTDESAVYVLSADHTYENGTCTGCGDHIGPVITQQPESVQREVGKKFAITVKAEGEDLTYQWYYKDAGMKNFGKSSNKTASYAYTMQTYMHNRQVYCVITDANGNSVQTETATISRPPQALRIVEQPQDARVNVGEKFSISPKVEGEGLTYQWYVKEAGAKAFKVSSIKGSAYALTMQKYMIGRQVYCVITDKDGNSVTTDVATISLPPVELKILQQPTDVYAAKGEKFSISPEVQGDGLTYQWYYKEGYMKDFKPSSNKTSAYAYSMQTYMNERSVYCVITDKYGNQVVTEVVTIHLKK